MQLSTLYLFSILSVAPGFTHPAPAPPSQFVAFFNYDSPDLTPAGQQIVAQAAAAANASKPATIEIAGDFSLGGAGSMNARLSEARYKAVLRELSADGVDRKLLSRIHVRDLTVPMPDTGSHRIEIRLVANN